MTIYIQLPETYRVNCKIADSESTMLLQLLTNDNSHKNCELCEAENERCYNCDSPGHVAQDCKFYGAVNLAYIVVMISTSLRNGYAENNYELSKSNTSKELHKILSIS